MLDHHRLPPRLPCSFAKRAEPIARVALIMSLAVCAALVLFAWSRTLARADEIYLPRYYVGAFTFYNMQAQEARLELEAPLFDPVSNKLLVSGTEWYNAANTWYSIPVKIEIDTDTFRFSMVRQIADCDNALETPSVDPLIGVISSDFRKIVNDLSGEGENALEDFVFKAVAQRPDFEGPRIGSRCKTSQK